MPFDVTTTAQTGSTNRDLLEAGVAWRVLIADHQTAGRGRHERTWEAPAGSQLTISAAVPVAAVGTARLPWLPLLTGLAAVDALASYDVSADLKWPNDILLGGQKLAGILVELASDGQLAVIGMGLNTEMTAAQLPVPTATSLALAGVHIPRDELAAAFLAQLDVRLTQALAELRTDYTAACTTVGQRVTAQLPDDSTREGTAQRIGDNGEIVIDGQPLTAGDITHVRPV